MVSTFIKSAPGADGTTGRLNGTGFPVDTGRAIPDELYTRSFPSGVRHDGASTFPPAWRGVWRIPLGTRTRTTRSCISGTPSLRAERPGSDCADHHDIAVFGSACRMGGALQLLAGLTLEKSGC